jgi:hypothetical protein
VRQIDNKRFDINKWKIQQWIWKFVFNFIDVWDGRKFSTYSSRHRQANSVVRIFPAWEFSRVFEWKMGNFTISTEVLRKMALTVRGVAKLTIGYSHSINSQSPPTQIYYYPIKITSYLGLFICVVCVMFVSIFPLQYHRNDAWCWRHSLTPTQRQGAMHFSFSWWKKYKIFASYLYLSCLCLFFRVSRAYNRMMTMMMKREYVKSIFNSFFGYMGERKKLI